MSKSSPRPLGDWPGEIRFLLAVFLVATVVLFVATVAAIGNEWAGPNEFLPGPERLRQRLAGPSESPPSQVEHLLTAADGPFNGHGTMRPAFTTRSRDWPLAIEGKDAEGIRTLSNEREGECLALLSWIRAGADRSAYESDSFPEPADFAGQPLSREWRSGRGTIRIRSLIEARCVDCHAEGGRMERARSVPLDTYERLRPHVTKIESERLSISDFIRIVSQYGFGVVACQTGTGLISLFIPCRRWIRFSIAMGPIVAVVATAICCGLASWSVAFVWCAMAGGIATALGLAVQFIVCLGALAAPNRGVGPAKCTAPGGVR